MNGSAFNVFLSKIALVWMLFVLVFVVIFVVMISMVIVLMVVMGRMKPLSLSFLLVWHCCQKSFGYPCLAIKTNRDKVQYNAGQRKLFVYQYVSCSLRGERNGIRQPLEQGVVSLHFP